MLLVYVRVASMLLVYMCALHLSCLYICARCIYAACIYVHVASMLLVYLCTLHLCCLSMCALHLCCLTICARCIYAVWLYVRVVSMLLVYTFVLQTKSLILVSSYVDQQLATPSYCSVIIWGQLVLALIAPFVHLRAVWSAAQCWKARLVSWYWIGELILRAWRSSLSSSSDIKHRACEPMKVVANRMYGFVAAVKLLIYNQME